MAFFGLNFLGDYDVFGTAKAHKLERLTAIPESTFVETFRAMCAWNGQRLGWHGRSRPTARR